MQIRFSKQRSYQDECVFNNYFAIHFTIYTLMAFKTSFCICVHKKKIMHFHTFCHQIQPLVTHLREALDRYNFCLLTQKMVICLMDQVNVCKNKNIFDILIYDLRLLSQQILYKRIISLFLSKQLFFSFPFPTTIQRCVFGVMF